ncbi:hypothetical protein [Actinoplanes derwentensis]|uniref:LysM domain-containing protein n=1 Tax=Actinoplanes derwentensis TaxID=113562 RepID=A0A1H2C8I3_9ACTN|nr:hypothetical protein [Actinoplanes derwentensis]GID86534.1 hypothetical protein Ade03nite_54580 [Actinoplanes derwentensis]SDT66587.1 hypothetical protein SAMN04489716_5366 [Actinoplanes derwentensis]
MRRRSAVLGAVPLLMFLVVGSPAASANAVSTTAAFTTAGSTGAFTSAAFTTIAAGRPVAALRVPGETGKYYIVGKPVRGQREYLFAIAARTLGDGNRYREIFDLNEGRGQPDGKSMDKSATVEPGWILILPADAKGRGVKTGALPGIGPTAPVAKAPSVATPAPAASAAATTPTVRPEAARDDDGETSGLAVIWSPNGLRIALFALAVLLLAWGQVALRSRRQPARAAGAQPAGAPGAAGSPGVAATPGVAGPAGSTRTVGGSGKSSGVFGKTGGTAGKRGAPPVPDPPARPVRPVVGPGPGRSLAPTDRSPSRPDTPPPVPGEPAWAPSRPPAGFPAWSPTAAGRTDNTTTSLPLSSLSGSAGDGAGKQFAPEQPTEAMTTPVPAMPLAPSATPPTPAMPVAPPTPAPSMWPSVASSVPAPPMTPPESPSAATPLAAPSADPPAPTLPVASPTTQPAPTPPIAPSAGPAAPAPPIALAIALSAAPAAPAPPLAPSADPPSPGLPMAPPVPAPRAPESTAALRGPTFKSGSTAAPRSLSSEPDSDMWTTEPPAAKPLTPFAPSRPPARAGAGAGAGAASVGSGRGSGGVGDMGGVGHIRGSGHPVLAGPMALAVPGLEPKVLLAPPATANPFAALVTDLFCGGDPAKARLIGARPARWGSAYGWLDEGQQPPPSTAPVILGELNGRRLWIDLAVVPDALTVGGDAGAARRAGLAIAAGFGEDIDVLLVGDVLSETLPGGTLPGNIRRIGAVAELAGDRSAARVRVVVCAGADARGLWAPLRALAPGRQRTVPVIIGAGAAARWSMRMGAAT